MQFVRLFTICVLGFACHLYAQDTLSVDQKTLNQHVLQNAPPFYPPIAKAAGVQGTVVLDVHVSSSGKVESVNVVSGPAMLQQAAVDAVMKRTYKPFEKDGTPVSARGLVSIIYTLGGGTAPKDAPTANSDTTTNSPKTITLTVAAEDANDGGDDKIASEFFKVWNLCTRGVLAHSKTSETASTCTRAADIADQFPQNARYIERRSSAVYAATALANIGNFKDALPYASRAVEVTTLGHDDDSGTSAAYSVRGTIEGYLGDFTSADRDLTVSEDHQRRAIASMEKDAPTIAAGGRTALARDLRFHAQVLHQLNRPEDAQAKLDEASKL